MENRPSLDRQHLSRHAKRSATIWSRLRFPNVPLLGASAPIIGVVEDRKTGTRHHLGPPKEDSTGMKRNADRMAMGSFAVRRRQDSIRSAESKSSCLRTWVDIDGARWKSYDLTL